jgi:hypothetical protein
VTNNEITVRRRKNIRRCDEKKMHVLFFLRTIAAGEKSVNIHIRGEKNNDRGHPLLSVRLNMPSVYIDR